MSEQPWNEKRPGGDHQRGEGQEEARKPQVRIVEQMYAVGPSARLVQPYLEHVADRLIEQIHDRDLEAALRVDGECRCADGAADGPQMEVALGSVERDRAPERQGIGDRGTVELPVDPRTAAPHDEREAGRVPQGS